MKKISKVLSGVLAFMLIVTMCSIGMTAYAATDDVIGNYSFDITSTYKDIDWNNWKQYKGATHVHTVRSDADTEIDDMIEYYYGFGYDDLALTDHGTVNYGWTSGQSRIAIFDYQFFVHGAMDEPSKARYTEITTGTGAIKGESASRGFPMREIPMGIELNGMSTKKCHINGFYVDYGHGDLGISVSWPRDAVAGNYNKGGLTHINHVGEWSDAKSDRGVYDAKFISDFASIYEDYGIMKKGRNESNLRGCLGMELVNTADNRTRNDRYLYDEILKILAPQGINVLGFCEDDAHELSDCDRNAQYFIMPSNDVATNNVKHCMEYGQFYTVSKNSKNSYELGDGFAASGEYPRVSYVGVDDAKNQIIINSTNANKVRLVADGEIIDLGGRKIEVVYIPGHTKGSIALLDVENRVLYSGDSVQNGNIYMFGAHRNTSAFLPSLKKLEKMSDRFDLIYPCHGDPVLDSDYVGIVKKAWENVISSNIVPCEESLHGFVINCYHADGCGFYMSK